MENSGTMLFDDDTPQWYLAVGERWIGPLAASDVYERILSHQITWAHFIWKKGQSDWKRICDTKAFQAAGPHEPKKSIQKEVQEAVKPSSKKGQGLGPDFPPFPGSNTQERIWFLFYDETQFGPFSYEEVKQFLEVEKITPRAHAWHAGMENWERLFRIPEFEEFKGAKGALPAPPLPKESSKSSQKETKKEGRAREKRSQPRMPLVAKIFMTDEESVLVGVCRDISTGGLQVLVDKVPGRVGTKLKMNISPSKTDSQVRIEPFVATGKIVRILEDGRGFSFRFERLSEKAKQSIGAYIESGQ